MNLILITARKQSLGQGNIFRSLCQEFSSQGGGIPACIAGGIPAWDTSLEGVSRPTPGGSPGPHLGVGGCVSQHALRQIPPWMATAEGGMHPTGMHSHFNSLIEKITPIRNKPTVIQNSIWIRFFGIKSEVTANETDVRKVDAVIYVIFRIINLCDIKRI